MATSATGLVLKVHILSASSLLAADNNGLSDPYVKVKIGGIDYLRRIGLESEASEIHITSTIPIHKRNVFCTKVINKNLNPVWNEQFQISNFTRDSYIVLSLYDKDFLVNDHLGYAAISIEKIICELCYARNWYKTSLQVYHGTGRVICRFAFVNSNIDRNLLLDPHPLSFKYIRIQHIQIEKQIGHGSFGIVSSGYLITDPLRRRLAIKQLSDPKKHTNIQAELDIMQQLKHPNIITFYGSIAEPDFIYILMELADLGTLRSVLDNRSIILPLKVEFNIAIETAFAVCYLHEKKIVHRDIKSLNVLLKENYHAKLCDFGISKPCDVFIQSQTHTTLNWAPPEQLELGRCTFKSDVYSLTLTFWEIITKQIPYPKVPIGTLVQKKKTENLNIPPTTPQIVAEILQRGWNINPDLRPEAREFVESLIRAKKTLKLSRPDSGTTSLIHS
eukprot:TRINITY_DN1351_c0_g2_i1.p1 TRINITY_DN1351_c0_g2~~TRINITY_DN1351_c0_g2_i1.p1  ORF type:complete len:447 (+),score=121.89 TRINITY_DN1351_c0_g2_i1:46-1386(+)